ncbi:hypothetical protein J5X84_06045 [Streptosporangiaceae bacterium NEAU-GS5]|nr:hypothetical protein [Streptosporangiaceae bacterium NEAU-GS5]
MRPFIRSLSVTCGTIAVALILAPLTAAHASPTDPDPNAPRSWTFWQSDGLAWTAGPDGQSTPKDGAVIGWRFAASPDAPGEGDSPREMVAFDQVCGKDKAQSGQKRIALAVDYGDAEVDAYPGDTPPKAVVKCVVAPDTATSLQVLSTIGASRVDGKGVVLAVSDYPAKAKDSGTAVAADTASASGGDSGGGSSLPLILGGAGALVVIAGAGVLLARRRTKA